jgi:hypothetical protein
VQQLLVPEAIHSRFGIWRFLIAAAGAVLVVLAGTFFLYARRLDHPVLYYHGAAREVPQGTAIAILNPFRDRKDEANAEWLMRDLRTDRCEQIARDRLSSDPSRVCPVLRNSTKASLIWLDAESKNGVQATTRDLWYDLPESRSRLVVHFANSESGWGVNTVELLR